MENSYCWGTGRRKNALARVRLCPGNGELKINDRTVEEYFPRLVWQAQVLQSLKVTNLEGKVDVFVNASGGGLTGQAGAIKMGIAVNKHMEAAQAASSFDASIAHWKNAAWDGKTGFGMKGDAAWAWLVNLQHIYLVDKCLDIGPRQIEPHGHGYPVTWNMQDWKWTCQ